MKFIFVLITLVAVAATACAQNVAPKPAQSTKIDEIVGDWNGESKCTGTNPNCHDEVVVYHLTRSKTDAAKINVSADKIVDGKPDNMGDFDMAFDPEKMTLTVEFAFQRSGGKGVWLFTIDGNKMDGTLTNYPEKLVSRNVHLGRKKT